MSRMFKIISGFILAILSFVFFLLSSFPLDDVFIHFFAKIEEQTQGQFRITVEKMEPSLIFDSKFKGVVISKKTESGFENVFSSKNVSADISLFSLLSKSINVGFSAEFSGGKLQGSFVSQDQKNQIDIRVKDVSLEKLGFVKGFLQAQTLTFDPEGIVDGDLFISLSPQGLRASDAEFNFKVKKFQVKNINLQIKNGLFANSGFVIPDLELSTMENPALLQGSLVNNQLRLHDLVLPGPDLDLELKGKLNLRQEKNKISISRFDMKGRFAFSEKITNSLQILSLLSEQKGADGYYPLTLSGRIERPAINIGEMDLSKILGLN